MEQPEISNGHSPVCFMFIGLPGSGKTTYCHSMFPHLPRVSSDDHIEAMCREKGLTYSEGFSMFAKEAERAMYIDLAYYVRYNLDFVWDQTNLSSLSRERKLSKLSPEYVVHAFVFKEPADLQKRLDGRKGKHIPPSVIQTMRESYERPTKEEGFAFITDVIS